MQKNLYNYLSLLRPHQWLKNLLLFFPPFFGGKLFEPLVLSAALPSFVSFSLAASCCYIINDIKDRELDRHHPQKKYRAIANGEISVAIAWVLATLLYITAMLISSSVSARFEGFIILYLLLTFGYTIYFKNIVIVDIFIIAFGFLIRVLAGGTAFKIEVTSWLFLTVFIVSLFLAAGKRMGEIVSLSGDAQNHRKSLHYYSSSFLEGILWFTASSSLVTYALYTLENRKALIYTVPLAAFGLVRYIYLVKEGMGDPTDALLKDWQIMGVGTIWAITIGIITYL